MRIMLSIVIVYYNIPEQFRRTLFSLSPGYQTGIDADQYEVIVIDNGSSSPPDIREARALGMNVEVIRIDPESSSISPAQALNIGLNASLGRYVGCFIDGARLASPGLLEKALTALQISDRAVVGSRGRYLGPKYQQESMLEGYDSQVESSLLKSIDWTANGYRLFEISVFDESSGKLWSDPINESNSLFMSRAMWQELGGFDMRFKAPGGGFVNLDTWRRACELTDVVPIILLGEATFHQIHGGVATNGTTEEIKRMHDEYVRLRGSKFMPPQRPFYFWGQLPHTYGYLKDRVRFRGGNVPQSLRHRVLNKLIRLTRRILLRS